MAHTIRESKLSAMLAAWLTLLVTGGCVSGNLPGDAPMPSKSSASIAQTTGLEKPSYSTLRDFNTDLMDLGTLYVGNSTQVAEFAVAGRNQRDLKNITNGLSPSAFAAGATVDASGHFYVADSYQVLRYPRGGSTPDLTYTANLQFAPDVAVGVDGTVYVTENYSNGDAGVVVYPPGSTQPEAYYHTETGATGVTLDKNGYLYVSLVDHGDVIRFEKGSSKFKRLFLYNLHGPYGIIFDGKGNMVVADTVSNEIDVYRPGRRAPSKVLSLPSPYYLAFAAGGTRLFVSTLLGSGLGYVSELEWPSGKLVEKITNGLSGGFVTGLAVDPNLTPPER